MPSNSASLPTVWTTEHRRLASVWCKHLRLPSALEELLHKVDPEKTQCHYCFSEANLNKKSYLFTLSASPWRSHSQRTDTLWVVKSWLLFLPSLQSEVEIMSNLHIFNQIQDCSEQFLSKLLSLYIQFRRLCRGWFMSITRIGNVRSSVFFMLRGKMDQALYAFTTHSTP